MTNTNEETKIFQSRCEGEPYRILESDNWEDARIEADSEIMYADWDEGDEIKYTLSLTNDKSYPDFEIFEQETRTVIAQSIPKLQ